MHVFGAPNFRKLGERILIVESDGEPSVERQMRFAELAREMRAFPGVVECVPAMGNLSFYVDPASLSLAALERRVRDRWRSCAEASLEGALHTIPVRYDGPDLEEVAAHAGIGASEVVTKHTSREYVVWFLGFQPGFAYLGGLDPVLRVPRRAEPRSRVEAGSVAIGAAMTGIYPFASPGGWNVIGRTEAWIFDRSREAPVRFAPGDRVRFVAC